MLMFSSKPVDFAILKSLAANSTPIEKEILRALSREQDVLSDFEFTPIHIAVLDLYSSNDTERPSLTQLIDFVDNANNAPPGTDWSAWKSRYKRRSPLFQDIIAQFAESAQQAAQPRTHKVMHNLFDQKDRKFHWTPLHWASATGKADKMRILVESGADPFIQSNISFNIIHAAVEANALQSLKYALELSRRYPEKLNVNQANTWGETPLLMAAQGCLVDCIKLLLEAGADRNARQENGQVALHYAGLSKRTSARVETVRLLLTHDGPSTACPTQSSDALRASNLQLNIQDEDGRPPIFDFIGDTESLALMISQGADLALNDNEGKNIFHHICAHDDSEALAILLELPHLRPKSHLDLNLPPHFLHSVPDSTNTTPFMTALQSSSISCATIFFSHSITSLSLGPLTDSNGWSPIHYAVRIGDTKLLELVLQHPSFRKGARTKDGMTAREVAMREGKWCGEVKTLLREWDGLA